MPLPQYVLDAQQRMNDADAALRAYVDSGAQDRDKHRELVRNLERAIRNYLGRMPILVNHKPCACGCGKYPKKHSSKFLPGHDLRKAYQESGKLK